MKILASSEFRHVANYTGSIIGMNKNQAFCGDNKALTARKSIDCTIQSRYSNRAVSNSNRTVTVRQYNL